VVRRRPGPVSVAARASASVVVDGIIVDRPEPPETRARRDATRRVPSASRRVARAVDSLDRPASDSRVAASRAASRASRRADTAPAAPAFSFSYSSSSMNR